MVKQCNLATPCLEENESYKVWREKYQLLIHINFIFNDILYYGTEFKIHLFKSQKYTSYSHLRRKDFLENVCFFGFSEILKFENLIMSTCVLQS